MSEVEKLKAEVDYLNSLVLTYRHIKDIWREKCYEHLSKKVTVFESVMNLDDCCLDQENDSRCCLKKKLVHLLQLIEKL